MRDRRRLLVLALLAVVATAGCGGEEAPSDDAGAVSDGLAHIHGLGINPADDALIVATHTGLFRAAPGAKRAARIGDRRQDTMGFTVVGPDRFLGSGHPDARDDLPPLLGLIRSDDAGKTWESVSLLGEADFHVLRASGERIYGVNATDGRLLVSNDGGKTWAERTPPGPLLDLAVDPRDPDRVVVSSESGLYSSPDAGRGWRPLDTPGLGLLAWTDELVLVDGQGDVHASGNDGRSFQRVGRVGGQPAALASHGDELLVALHDNSVRMSSDGGRSWAVRLQGGS